jgi:hypothetical protein
VFSVTDRLIYIRKHVLTSAAHRLSRTSPSSLLYKGKMSDGNGVSHRRKDKAPRILHHCIQRKRVVGQLHGKAA